MRTFIHTTGFFHAVIPAKRNLIPDFCIPIRRRRGRKKRRIIRKTRGRRYTWFERDLLYFHKVF